MASSSHLVSPRNTKFVWCSSGEMPSGVTALHSVGFVHVWLTTCALTQLAPWQEV